MAISPYLIEKAFGSWQESLGKALSEQEDRKRQILEAEYARQLADNYNWNKRFERAPEMGLINLQEQMPWSNWQNQQNFFYDQRALDDKERRAQEALVRQEGVINDFFDEYGNDLESPKVQALANNYSIPLPTALSALDRAKIDTEIAKQNNYNAQAQKNLDWGNIAKVNADIKRTHYENTDALARDKFNKPYSSLTLKEKADVEYDKYRLAIMDDANAIRFYTAQEKADLDREILEFSRFKYKHDFENLSAAQRADVIYNVLKARDSRDKNKIRLLVANNKYDLGKAQQDFVRYKFNKEFEELSAAEKNEASLKFADVIIDFLDAKTRQFSAEEKVAIDKLKHDLDVNKFNRPYEELTQEEKADVVYNFLKIKDSGDKNRIRLLIARNNFDLGKARQDFARYKYDRDFEELSAAEQNEASLKFADVMIGFLNAKTKQLSAQEKAVIDKLKYDLDVDKFNRPYEELTQKEQADYKAKIISALLKGRGGRGSSFSSNRFGIGISGDKRYEEYLKYSKRKQELIDHGDTLSERIRKDEDEIQRRQNILEAYKSLEAEEKGKWISDLSYNHLKDLFYKNYEYLLNKGESLDDVLFPSKGKVELRGLEDFKKRIERNKRDYAEVSSEIDDIQKALRAFRGYSEDTSDKGIDSLTSNYSLKDKINEDVENIPDSIKNNRSFQELTLGLLSGTGGEPLRETNLLTLFPVISSDPNGVSYEFDLREQIPEPALRSKPETPWEKFISKGTEALAEPPVEKPSKKEANKSFQKYKRKMIDQPEHFFGRRIIKNEFR